MLTGQYPCTEEDAIYLGGLSMQVVNYIMITKLQFMYDAMKYIIMYNNVWLYSMPAIGLYCYTVYRAI